jgi:uncharacterized protein (UPF0548 family)
VHLVRPTDAAALALYVEKLRISTPTYGETGGTLTGARPAGFRHDHYEMQLGQGSDVFDRAVGGLRTWQAHRVLGVRVYPIDPVEIGATVVVTLGAPLAAVAAPCRVVAVIDEPTQWGFAYGTLPGHPECGEEAFMVTMEEETVHFTITAFSRPAGPLVRVTAPIGRRIQRRATLGYLRALRRFVDQ